MPASHLGREQPRFRTDTKKENRIVYVESLKKQLLRVPLGIDS